MDAVCSNGLASSLGPRPAYGKLGEGLDCKRREAGRGPGLQATGSWARAWTASDGKLGEGLDCKRREAGRGTGLQATGSWARAWTASGGKLGEGLDCKRREAGRGPGLQATGSWARAWERGFEGEIRLKHARNCDLSCTAVLCHYHARV